MTLNHLLPHGLRYIGISGLAHRLQLWLTSGRASGRKTRAKTKLYEIKWWRLREDNLKVQLGEKVLDKVRPVECVQEWWEETSTRILRVGQEVLGMTTGRRPPGDKETWWWNDKVQEVIKAKKVAKKIYGKQHEGKRTNIYTGRQTGGKESRSNKQGTGNERVV